MGDADVAGIPLRNVRQCGKKEAEAIPPQT